MKITNLVNCKFGRLLVISFAGRNKTSKKLWLCLCDCGKEKVIQEQNLQLGRSLSCGCLHSELLIKNLTTHGLASRKNKLPECYYVWIALKQRCLNIKCKHYERYGGRGVKVCDRWVNSFINFISDMGPRPSIKHSIERKDNSGDYSPENCIWALIKVQARNKRNNVWLTYKGETLIRNDWAKKLNMCPQTLRNKLKSKSLDVIIDEQKR